MATRSHHSPRRCWSRSTESDTPFTFRIFGPGDPQAAAEWERISPMKRFPVLVDDGRVLIETSIIIEHLALSRLGAAPLIPADPAAALNVRLMDRMFDSYVRVAVACGRSTGPGHGSGERPVPRPSSPTVHRTDRPALAPIAAA